MTVLSIRHQQLALKTKYYFQNQNKKMILKRETINNKIIDDTKKIVIIDIKKIAINTIILEIIISRVSWVGRTLQP